MLNAYRELAAEREAQGVPALPLNAEQTKGLTELLQNPPPGEEQTLLHMLSERVPPGVDEAAYVKATWLSAVAQNEVSSPLLSPLKATRLLGTMVGGYNVSALIELLQHSDDQLAGCAAEGLSRTLLVYDAFNEVMELAESNRFAKQVVDSWAAAEWFTSKPELAEEITVTVFKVEGETNTRRPITGHTRHHASGYSPACPGDAGNPRSRWSQDDRRNETGRSVRGLCG